MSRENSSLSKAKQAKFDEFYTQYADIEKEMNAYLEYDPDVFRGKTILLPCDDPEWSNFTKYFAQKFESLGIKKLISTSFAPESRTYKPLHQPTLFEMDSPKFDAEKSRAKGKLFILERDSTGDKKVDVDDLEWSYLEGDGDFRSPEVTALRDQADIIITNPPFSLFQEFLSWLVKGEKSFIIIGNSNAITYKEVFRLIKDNLLWLGATRTGVGQMWFLVGDDAPEKTGQKIENGQRLQTIGNAAWFTNINHGRRHEFLELMSEADNIKFSKHKQVKGVGYQKYDNYGAIEVPRIDAIPSDYPGVMGVPITFLGKYNPDQFEILGITKTWDDPSGLKHKTYPTQIQVNSKGSRISVGKLNDGAAIAVTDAGDSTHYEVDGKKYVQVYARVLIRHREAVK